MTNKPALSLSPEQQAMVSLLAERIFGGAETAVLTEQVDQILQESEYQSVFPYVYSLLEKRDPQACASWKLKYFQYISNNFNIINAHYVVHTMLQDAGIPYTIIKGCASSFYYPEPEYRAMGDVDLYVERQSMEQVRTVFAQHGCDVSGMEHPHHWSFDLNGVTVEVHWAPSGIPAEDDGTIRSMFDDLIARRREISICEQNMFIPNPFHHGMIMLLHTANHLTAGGIGLRHLLDWLVFVNAMPEPVFCELFQEKLKNVGLWQFARVLTAVGVQFFSCEYRAFCEDVSFELAIGLLIDILDGGNFGVKDADRLNQSKLLRNETSRRVNNSSRFKNGLSFMNQRAQKLYPPCARCPLLLPIGWIKVFRHRNDAVRDGKQSKVHLRTTLRKSRERERLYSELKLFET